MKETPKVDRKILKKADLFVSRGRLFIQFLVKRKRPFLIILAVIGVSIVSVYGFESWSRRLEEEAWLKFKHITEEKDEKKWVDLSAFALENKSRRSGFLASIQLGDHFFDLRKKEVLEKADLAPVQNEAIQWYSRALEFGDLLPMERQLIYVNRAKTHELEKRYEDAASDLKMAENLGGELKAFVLLNLARIYELKKDLEKAKGLYEKISIDYVSTEYAKLAKVQLRRLKSPLFPQAEEKSG